MYILDVTPSIFYINFDALHVLNIKDSVQKILRFVLVKEKRTLHMNNGLVTN